MSLLEKRWLKAISMDPRIRLFGGLNFDEDAEPLFRQEDIAVYDRFEDGDPYDSPKYREIFRTLLTAIKQGKAVEIAYLTQRGTERAMTRIPDHLEYSEKDDKFRLIVCGENRWSKLNLSRMEAAVLREKDGAELLEPRRSRNEYIVELTDERNALERAMLHFADLEKRTERLEENRYRMTLFYDPEDETELVIRVLSFGPMLRAVAPGKFVDQIRYRLKKQRMMDW